MEKNIPNDLYIPLEYHLRHPHPYLLPTFIIREIDVIVTTDNNGEIKGIIDQH